MACKNFRKSEKQVCKVMSLFMCYMFLGYKVSSDDCTRNITAEWLSTGWSLHSCNHDIVAGLIDSVMLKTFESLCRIKRSLALLLIKIHNSEPMPILMNHTLYGHRVIIFSILKLLLVCSRFSQGPVKKKINKGKEI